MPNRRLNPSTVLLLTHPVVVACVAALLVNDHVAKERWPGFATGLASDIAGLALAPILFVAAIEAARRRPLPLEAVLSVAAMVAVGFAAVELVPIAEYVWRHSLGVVGAPARWILEGEWSTAPVVATSDLFDLLALPAVMTGEVLRQRICPNPALSASSPARRP